MLCQPSTATGGTQTSDLGYVHDKAGNLVFDGRLLYAYDGLNHLVEVRDGAGLSAAAHFDAAGAPNGAAGGLPIPRLLSRFAYDGFGRLISKHFLASRQVTSQNPWTYVGHYANADYFYDGVRRVQEVIRFSTMVAGFLWSVAADRPPAFATDASCQPSPQPPTRERRPGRPRAASLRAALDRGANDRAALRGAMLNEDPSRLRLQRFVS